MSKSKKTQEVIEIEAAVEKWKGVRLWEKNISAAFWIMYFIAFTVWIFIDGIKAAPIFLMVLVLFFAKIIIGYRESKLKWTAVRLIDTFSRKNAVPFYNDLVERFKDQPNLHIHLDEHGMIHIKDNGKKER